MPRIRRSRGGYGVQPRTGGKYFTLKKLNPKCLHCGSSNIGAWGPDADKCFDCEMTWKV